MDLFSVRDRLVIVTGGLGLLGTQCSRTLLGCGANVVAFDLEAGRWTEPQRQRAAELAAEAGWGHVPVDVGSAGSLRAGLDRVVERWGVPSALVNFAAIDFPPDGDGGGPPFEEYEEPAWDQVMHVNAGGVFRSCQVVGTLMAGHGGGAIVNVASTYGLVAPDQRLYAYRSERGATFTKPVSYTASKAAVLGMTRYLATYWASRNLRVNALVPGGVLAGQDERFVRAYCDRVPLGRMAMVHEYDAPVIFLLSDASSYMTGASLVVDGGWTSW